MIVVYDGECPLCSSYVHFYRIRDLGIAVDLVDARENHPIVTEIAQRGLDINLGMVVKFEGRWFHGAEAMHMLAMLGSGDSVFNAVNRAIFRHRRLAAVLYPVLVQGRKFLLWLLGRRLIGETKVHGA
jgi:predicted DCC family thiol-disulfide oxidoreductase YuxK